MNSKASMFSQDALKKLRSPEKLDMVLEVIKPSDWLILFSVGIIIIVIILWSILGSYTEKIPGVGMIIDYDGVIDVAHPYDGIVTNVFVDKGSHIKSGDLIATIYNREVIAESNSNIEAHDNNMKVLKNQMVSNIYSPQDGIVEEIKIKNGEYINPGTSICLLRLKKDRDELKGIVFVPLNSAKRIKEDMQVQFSTNASDPKDSGLLLASVASVSDYPVSLQRMKMLLGNSELAQSIMQQYNGGLMEVSVDLIIDENDKSNYLWTNSMGEHAEVTPGTFCQAEIIIDRKPPIEKVFYNISQLMGK